MNQYDKDDDARVTKYIKRAHKILGIELEGDYKTPENLLKMTELVLKVAKMLQTEQLEFNRRIRGL
jgi:hypothetical protein